MKHLPRATAGSWSGMMLALALACTSACWSSSPPGGPGGAAGAGPGGAAGAALGGAGGAAPASLGQGGHVLVAEILESASTNSRSMKVEIFADASAERTIGPPTALEEQTGGGLGPLDGTPKSFPPGSTEALVFVQTLARVNDVSAIPIRRDCTKSTSFGTTTTVRVSGKTSGDLQCIDSESDAGDVTTGEALYEACHALERSL